MNGTIKSRLDALEIKKGAGDNAPIIVCLNQTKDQAVAEYEARHGVVVGDNAICIQFKGVDGSVHEQQH
ncbi:hypothetical protein [Candidatus Venteria ishoeyi]|uniref:Uncharacterized protein n=1 Tax=Candidatus Venteria ishoeyi TaxID=1899563 RepID=A0A1H6F999_9GAMM|nr:hypothetical protein [Candidatus Venteria ishoeyi]SEH06690.1 Uncharacterised protein [Candidatus Venteria ishoeyi]